MRPTQRSTSATSIEVSAAITASMSTQSFARLNTTLHTSRCSTTRIGIVVSANGTTRVPRPSHRGRRRRRRTGRAASPPRTPGPAPLCDRRLDRRSWPPPTPRADRDLGEAVDRHEQVQVDVDRRPWLGVVGEGDGAAEGVGDRHERPFEGDDLLGERDGSVTGTRRMRGTGTSTGAGPGRRRRGAARRGGGRLVRRRSGRGGGRSDDGLGSARTTSRAPWRPPVAEGRQGRVRWPRS